MSASDLVILAHQVKLDQNLHWQLAEIKIIFNDLFYSS